MNKPKVMFLVNHEIVIYNFRKELVELLLTEGYEVIISSPPGDKIDTLVSLGARHINLEINRHGTNPFSELKILKHYNQIIKEVNPSIILTYTIKPNIYGGIAAKINSIPYISNITGLGNGFNKNKIISTFLGKLYKYSLSKANVIFYQNEDNYRVLNSYVKRENRSRILPGSGVNLDEFQYRKMPNEESIKILYFGRIMQSKGILELLKAIELLSPNYGNIEFQFLGFYENEDIKNKMEKAMEKYNIKYFGYQKNIKKYIEEAHAVILPSHHEGMSNALLEAAAIGRPLLASNIPGCKEVVDDGINGFLFEPKNELSIKDAIIKFVHLNENDRYNFSKASRAKVERNFDRNIINNIYLKKIKEI